MGKSFIDELNAIDRTVESLFKSQIANTLCFTRHEIPCGTLSINENFPLHLLDGKLRSLNRAATGKNHARDITVFHYLGDHNFTRDDFATPEAVQQALKRKDLSDAETVYQQKLQRVHDRIRGTIRKKVLSC